MAVLLASLAALTYGIADYCGGRASRTVISTAVAFWAEAAGILLVIVLLPVFDEPFIGTADIWWSLGTALAAAAGLVAFYRALASGAMGVVAPITAVISAVIPVFVGLAQGERPGTTSMVGVALAVLAIALVTGAGSGAAVRPTMRTLLLAAIGGVGFAMVFVTLDATSENSGVWPLLVARIGALPLIALIARALQESLAVPRPMWPLIVVGGLFDMGANVLYLVATTHGMLAVVAVITAMYPATTVCLAVGLDRERLARAQLLGLVLAAGALVLVAVGKA